MESARITKFRNLNYEQQQKILFHGSITNNNEKFNKNISR